MQSLPLSGKADGAGNCTINLPDRATGKRWKIMFIGVQCTSVAQSQAGVYLNNQFIIGTSHGNFDSASGDPSIDITSKDNVKIVWTGADANAACTATVWYDDAVH